MQNLTDEQRWQIVVDHHRIVEFWARWAVNQARGLSIGRTWSYGDYLQAGYIESYRSLKRWDPDKGKASTFLQRRLHGHMIDLVFPNRRRPTTYGQVEISLDEVLAETELSIGESFLMVDLTSEHPYEQIEIEADFERLLSTLRPRDAEIMRRRANEETLDSIAKDYDIGESRTSQITSRIAQRWIREYHAAEQS